MEACRWVGRGHATQIEPPPVPICGPRDPKIRGKGGPTAGKGKGKRKGGWRLGKGARVSFLLREFPFRERVFLICSKCGNTYYLKCGNIFIKFECYLQIVDIDVYIL